MEEELNKEKIDEDSLAKKVRSKKRIRGLLIFINVILASYLVFEASMKIYNFASSLNNKEDIILLKPIPNPACLQPPYLLKSRYQP